MGQESDLEERMRDERAIGEFLASQLIAHLIRIGGVSMKIGVLGGDEREYEIVITQRGGSKEPPAVDGISIEQLSILAGAIDGYIRMVGESATMDDLVSRGLLKEAKAGSKVLPGMRTFRVTAEGETAIEAIRARGGLNEQST